MTRSLTRMIAVLLTGLSVTATGCGVVRTDRSVSVLAIWTDDEQKDFQKVLDAFTAKTGIRTAYRGTRALEETVQANLQRGTPPDIGILPSAGELAQYARDHEIHPLNSFVSGSDQASYERQWLLPLNGAIYTVPIKASLKSIIWYDPARFAKPTPRTWTDLLARVSAIAGRGGTPWCMGMGDVTGPGWPGTDWIEDILLHQSGPEIYHQWTSGALKWNSGPVRKAWQTWGQVGATGGRIDGGTTSALLTDFGDGGRALFANPPQSPCYLEHQPSFITGSYRKDGSKDRPLKPGTDYDFFPFPRFSGGDSTRQPVEASADLAAMFNDTPEARKLMGFLATKEAQRIWPAISGSGAYSLNKQVQPSVHGKDAIGTQIAESLQSASTLCPDAADLMPAAVGEAFDNAVLKYLDDPSRLGSLLEQLDAVPTEKKDWLNLPCSS